MRYHHLLFLSIAAMAAQPALGRSLSPQEALNRAMNQPHKVAPRHDISRNSVIAEPVLTVGSDEAPSLYIFNRAEKGFMIVSADEVAAPVLGYSDSEVLDVDNLPDNLKGWLENCSSQIRRASAAGAEPYSEAREADHAPIAALMTTKWNQTSPFNLDCPNHYPTGCVATAMAQVMKYHNWPKQASADANFSYTSAGQTYAADFSNFKFSWGNMLDVYSSGYTSEQADAVAKLMQACGYSVKMSYASSASGANCQLAGGGLANYFNYDQGLHNEPRDAYSASEWEQMIYDNLASCGPVIYWGGIHCFVCDGYQGNGYFHFNWGWGGDGDGCFLLNALNPSTVGTGGSPTGYNSEQGALLGIKPAGDVPSPRHYTFYNNGILSTKVTGTYLEISGLLVNYSPFTLNVQNIYSIYNEDGTEHIASVNRTPPTITNEDRTFTYEPDLRVTSTSGAISTDVIKTEGTYRIYPAVIIDDQEYLFIYPPSMPGYVIYTRTRTADGKSFVNEAKLPETGSPEIIDLSTNGNLYVNQNRVKVSGIGRFSGDASTTLKLSCRLLNSDNTQVSKFEDELTVEFTPEGTPFEGVCQWITSSSLAPGNYTFALTYVNSLNGSTTNVGTCPVTVLPAETTDYESTSFTVDKADAVDPDDIKLTVGVNGKSGYVYTDLDFQIFDPNDSKVWDKRAPLYVTGGSSTNVEIHASLPNATPGATYYAKVFKPGMYGSWNDFAEPAYFTIAKKGTTGIDEISAVTINGNVISAPEPINNVTLFSLSGQHTGVKAAIDGRTARLELSALACGLYIARIATVTGTHSLKLIKK